jgi:hypothetical protein
MLRLLEAPLSKLSDALEATQEHTQKLRAVLYDPSRTIFSAAPRVMMYFEEGRDIDFGKLRWKCVHEPENASPGEIRDLKLTVAAVVCEIFGCMEPPPENEGALISRASKALTDDKGDISFADLRNICSTLVVDRTNCFTDERIIKKAALNFKSVLYRPYKDGDDKHTWAPLFVGLYGFNKAFKTYIKIEDDWVDVAFDSLEQALLWDNVHLSLFQDFDLPVPRYSQWLNFLFGVLAYGKPWQTIRENEVILVPKASITRNAKKLSITIDFNKGQKNIFNDKEIKKVYKDLKKWFGKHDISFIAMGNFKKPFMDFILMAEGKVLKSDDSFKFSHTNTTNMRNYITTVQASGCVFSYSCEEVA